MAAATAAAAAAAAADVLPFLGVLRRANGMEIARLSMFPTVLIR